MRKLVISLLALGALACASTVAVAAPAAPAGEMSNVVHELDVIQKVQFVYMGHRHCWYPAGWHGPGWYWCGYAYRRGLGWGGPAGWHGWRHPAGPIIVHGHRGAVVVRGPHGGHAVIRRGHRYEGRH